MNHGLRWVVWSGLFYSLAFPVGAQESRIAPSNAHQVAVISQAAKSADHIILGPQKGELTITGWNSSLEVVDDVHFRTLGNVNDEFRPTDFARSRDGKFLTWTERNSTCYFVLDTEAGRTVEIDLGDHPGNAAFSPDGKLLAIGKTFWDPGQEGVGQSEMLLFDTSGKLLRTLEKSGPGGLKPVFSPDGKILAVGNRNYETRLFDVATGKLLSTLTKWMTQEIAFSPDGKTLATGYVDGSIAVWNTADGQLRRLVKAECDEVYSVDWNPTGDVLATSGLNGKIVLWDPIKLTPLAKFDAPLWVIQVRFTADGNRLLAASSTDGTGKPDRKIVTYAVPPAEK